MTEEQLFLKMLDRANIPYTKVVRGETKDHNMSHPDSCIAYTLMTPEDDDLNLGYTGFCGEFQFDKDGNLVTFGAWE